MTETNVPGAALSARHLFVGRQRELEVLRLGITETVAGNGRCFLLSGEAGIGKTRLAAEIDREATARGVRVFWGRCWESGGAPPFWPWAQALRPCFGDLAARATGATAAVSRLLEPHETFHGGAPARIDPEQERFQLFDSIATLLRAEVEDAPLLFILDDIHCADPDSLLLFTFLARQLRGVAVMLLGTYREVEAERDETVQSLLAELVRADTHVPLAGLNESEVGQMVAGALEAPPSTSVISSIYRACEGNPFFLNEILCLWIAEAHSASADPGATPQLRLPRQVRDAVRRRLALLSSPARRVLSVAALLGREFDRAMLELLNSLPEDRVLGVRVLGVGPSTPNNEHPNTLIGSDITKALEEACEAAVIREIAPQRRYSFTHALFGEVMYQDLPSSERISLHRRAGEAIEKLQAHDLDAHVADLAHHFSAAAADGDARRAIDYSRRAARRAADLGAFDEAVRHSTRALDLLEGSPASAALEGDHCSLLLELGDALNAAGRRAHAREIFARAAELARRLPNAEPLARAALGFGDSWKRMVEPNAEGGGPLVLNDAAARLLTEALARLGTTDDALRARVLARLAVERYFTSEPAERESMVADAVALARRSGDAETLSCVLGDGHVGIWGPDSVAQRREMAEELLGIAQQTGDRALLMMGREWYIGDLFELGECEKMEVEFERLCHEAASYRQSAHLWSVAVHKATRALLRGDFDRVPALAREARDLGEASHGLQHVAYGMQIGMLRRELGDFDRLRRSIDTLRMAAESLPSFPAIRISLAHTLAVLGEVDDARREIERAAAHELSDVRRDHNWLNTMCEAAEVCGRINDPTLAALIHRLLRPYIGFNALGILAALSWGSVARSVGVLETVLGKLDDAASSFRLALERNRALAAAPWIAHTQAGLATVLLARGSSGDATETAALTTAAARTAKQLGMKPLADRLRAEPRALTASPPVTRAEVSAPTNVYRLEGDYWTISYAGAVVRLKNSKGLQYIARLLRHPREEHLVLDLVSHDDGVSPRVGSELPVSGRGLGEEVVDARAIAAYRSRLVELRDALEEAEDLGDSGRASGLRTEMEELAKHLSEALGLGGRSRRTGSDLERARSAVTKRIHDAVKRIERDNPNLGQYLRHTIRTGYFCVYTPDAGDAAVWRL